MVSPNRSALRRCRATVHGRPIISRWWAMPPTASPLSITAIVQADATWIANNVTLVGNGAHSVPAQDTDLAGNIGTSTPVVFTLDQAPLASAVTLTACTV